MGREQWKAVAEVTCLCDIIWTGWKGRPRVTDGLPEGGIKGHRALLSSENCCHSNDFRKAGKLKGPGVVCVDLRYQ